MKIIKEVSNFVHISYLLDLLALARHWVGLSIIWKILI